MGAMGLFGLPFAEEHGGMGGDYFALCIALEELARVDSSVAITLEAAVSLGAMPIYRFGTRGAEGALAAPARRRGRRSAHSGSPSPAGGSDAGATRTTARLDGGEWVINGAKSFITNSGTEITDLVTVTAVTGERGGRKEISAIIVPAGTPGLTVSEKYSKVGWAASDTREPVLRRRAGARGEPARRAGPRVRAVPGDPRRGPDRDRRARRWGSRRAASTSRCATPGSGRRSAGAIGEYQAVQFKIADMEARAHTARLAYYDAAARMLRGEPFKKEAAIAKLVASNAAMDNAREATQVFGGYGFMNEYPVARFYRDAKVLEIGEGTSEIQRMVIARELGL